jgi:hypothetical protein
LPLASFALWSLIAKRRRHRRLLLLRLLAVPRRYPS